MADTSIPRVTLGPATLNRKWYLDVDTTPSGAATWVGVFGVSDFKPTKDYTDQDTSDFSSGYNSSAITALGWGVEMKVIRKTQAALLTAYDPGQEFLRTIAENLGIDNRAHIRFYEMNGATGPKIEAYDGFVSVTWEPEGGDMTATDVVTVKMTGQGKRNTIAHPAV